VASVGDAEKRQAEVVLQAVEFFGRVHDGITDPKRRKNLLDFADGG